MLIFRITIEAQRWIFDASAKVKEKENWSKWINIECFWPKIGIKLMIMINFTVKNYIITIIYIFTNFYFI